MIPPWWALLPPASILVPCGSGTHRLRWEQGRLIAADHPDAEAELVLAALGGDRTECTDLTEAWGGRSDDLEVLAVGPRSAADQLTITREEIEQLRPSDLGGTGSGGSGGLFSVLIYSARGMTGSPVRGRTRQLLSLLALGPGFQLRLSATVAAAWAEGGSRAADRAAARAALVAALAGRLAPAAQTWLDLDPDQIEVTLHEGAGWGRLAMNGERRRPEAPRRSPGWLAGVGSGRPGWP